MNCRIVTADWSHHQGSISLPRLQDSFLYLTTASVHENSWINYKVKPFVSESFDECDTRWSSQHESRTLSRWLSVNLSHWWIIHCHTPTHPTSQPWYTWWLFITHNSKKIENLADLVQMFHLKKIKKLMSDKNRHLYCVWWYISRISVLAI